MSVLVRQYWKFQNIIEIFYADYEKTYAFISGIFYFIRVRSKSGD